VSIPATRAAIRPSPGDKPAGAIVSKGKDRVLFPVGFEVDPWFRREVVRKREIRMLGEPDA
jgi:hypothetical protein